MPLIAYSVNIRAGKFWWFSIQEVPIFESSFEIPKLLVLWQI